MINVATYLPVQNIYPFFPDRYLIYLIYKKKKKDSIWTDKNVWI